jgi:hypothetical protein
MASEFANVSNGALAPYGLRIAVLADGEAGSRRRFWRDRATRSQKGRDLVCIAQDEWHKPRRSARTRETKRPVSGTTGKDIHSPRGLPAEHV